MTQSQIIALVRKLIADEQAAGFTEGGNLEQPGGTQELINYLDRAVDEVSRRKAEARDAQLLKRMTVTNGARLPDDFLFFAGNVPVNVDAGVMSFYGAATTLPVRYFARLPYVSACPSGELPYMKGDELTIAALAAIYALNKHEFNVSQDLMLLGMGGAVNAGQQ
ncbi:MAG: hypothetical protein IJR68_04745 [Fretibacterium sp.]|nr:hypothetical protein [Fretibacterium sp.]